MLTPGHLEIAAHSLTAILGVWLGLTVLLRSSAPASRVFAGLALMLVAWSGSVIIERLSTAASAIAVAHAIEEFSAAVVLPVTAHFSLTIATEGRPTRRRLRVIALVYLVNVLLVLPGVFNPAAPIAISPPNFGPGPGMSAALGWAWIAVRMVTLMAGAGWLVQAFGATRAGDPRRRQLGVTLATVVVGALGGIIRLLNVVVPTDAWIGVSLVTLAMVLSASAVFSAGLFFAPAVAARAFGRALALGVGLFVLVGALLGVDAASRTILGLDLPLLTVLALVVTIAVYEPLIAWSRTRLGGRSGASLARERILAALGTRSLAPQAADAGVQPALTRMTQALDLAGAVITRPDGSIAAAQGTAPDATAAPAIALVSGDEVVGELRVGGTMSGRPLRGGDAELLRLSAEYLAAALRTGRREDEQAEALTGLSLDRARVETSAARLHEALLRRSANPSGLRVYALGPLRVERRNASIERWGGEKAGTRQAQALFAFLFDRGERGVAKEEALEMIWPDTDVERADLAFHRTLGGLRHTLEPDGGSAKQSVRFHNDRYRLDPALIDWSDVALFLARLDQARVATDGAEGRRLLEEARTLYRGEYLDDCPFYGDSVHVEDRRASLRERSVDLLIELGASYEASSDRPSAVAAYREAVAVAGDSCPLAEAGLARLRAGV